MENNNKKRIDNIRDRIKRLQDIGIKMSVYAVYLDIPLKKVYNFINGKINFAKDQDTLDELERLVSELEEIFFFDNKND